MLKINRETDYAVLLLSHLARRADDGAQAAREAAGWIGISVPMASKVLKSLARAGLIVSNRGVKGGYGLGRPLEQITIGEVIEAIEGPLGIVECVSNPGHCDQEPCCPTSVNWKKINHALIRTLHEVRVSEMVQERSTLGLLQVGR